MLSVPNTYKQSVSERRRNQRYMVATIGIINQTAQKAAVVSESYGAQYSYLSNNRRLLENYDVEYEYATMEQDFFRADGRMLFPPREEDAEYLFNQGAVSGGILGSICIVFDLPYDIRGLTIDFGSTYPVDFTITNGIKTVAVSGNEKSYWTTEEIFEDTEYLILTPTIMRGGQDRFRIHTILMGIGVSFENKKIIKASQDEVISPVAEELPALDFSLSVENKGRVWDVENKDSAINYLEVGQEVTVRYGYEMPDGSVYWMSGCVCNLTDWEADDETMRFSAKDKINNLDDTYYRGKYRDEGVSLYDLAVDVLTDAGLDERKYDLDEYLKDITVYNPLPVATHKECLQIIANAGRCKLYTDREGRICIRAAFVTVISPERMAVTSEHAVPWSNLQSVVNGSLKYKYATLSHSHFRADGTMYFLPKEEPYLNTGFVSSEVADPDGNFPDNPKFSIALEAATSYYSLKLVFAGSPAEHMIIHTYFEGTLKESYVVPGTLEQENLIWHEFKQFDVITFEFTKAKPNSRIFVDAVVFGEVTDYHMDYRVMTRTPKGIQKEKVKRVDVVQSIYGPTDEIKNIFQETVDVTGYDTYTFYFSEASYDIVVFAGETELTITDSSSFYVTVDVSELTGQQAFIVDGKAYAISQKWISKEINPNGKIEEWNNPLISESSLAQLQADWLGNYFANNIEYEISYRGEPRIDAGDILFLENKYVENLQIQAYEHKLNFSGGLSGTMKARKAMSQEG